MLLYYKLASIASQYLRNKFIGIVKPRISYLFSGARNAGRFEDDSIHRQLIGVPRVNDIGSYASEFGLKFELLADDVRMHAI